MPGKTKKLIRLQAWKKISISNGILLHPRIQYIPVVSALFEQQKHLEQPVINTGICVFLVFHRPPTK